MSTASWAVAASPTALRKVQTSVLIINSRLGFGGALGPLYTGLPLLCIQMSLKLLLRSFGSLLSPWSIRAAISVMAAMANFPSLDLGIPPFQGFKRMVVDAHRDLSLRFNSMSRVSELRTSSSTSSTTPH